MPSSFAAAAAATSPQVGSSGWMFSVTRTDDIETSYELNYKLTPGALGTLWFGANEVVKQIWIDNLSPGVTTLELIRVNHGGKIATRIAGVKAVGTAPTPEPPEPTPEPTTPPILDWDFTKLPAIPPGARTNMWYGSDGYWHTYNGVTSPWPDEASSRTDDTAFQIYSDQGFNNVNPFEPSPNGLKIWTAPSGAPPPKTHTGGVLTTQNILMFGPGHRITVDMGPMDPISGQWPAAWLLGTPYSAYEGDEIDIFEAVSGDMGHLWHNAHLPRLAPDVHDWGSPPIPFDWTIGGSIILDWTTSELAFSVNGQRTHTVLNTGPMFQRPMFLILDNAVGPTSGGWADINPPSNIRAGTVFKRVVVERL